MEFFSPVAPSRVDERPLAGRLDGLEGRRIALLDNQKANAGQLLDAVGAEFSRRHPGVEIVVEKKIATSPSPPEVKARLRSVDAVVLAIAD